MVPNQQFNQNNKVVNKHTVNFDKKFVQILVEKNKLTEETFKNKSNDGIMESLNNIHKKIDNIIYQKNKKNQDNILYYLKKIHEQKLEIMTEKLKVENIYGRIKMEQDRYKNCHNYFTKQLKQKTKVVKKYEQMLMCNICITNPKTYILNCNHLLCDICVYAVQDQCPYCRKYFNIKNIRKFFF